MRLSERIPAQLFEIIAPRYKDNTVLLACYKVGMHNEIRFKAKHLEGSYYISGEQAKACPKQSNGKIMCYAVPMDFLEVLERE